MKLSKKNKKYALFILAIIALISVVIFTLTATPYFLNFNQSQISNNSQDWGAFGSFIAGLTGT